MLTFNLWSQHLLSFGGREVIIKAVGQSTPAYLMGCYLLPQNFDDIVCAIRDYCWSGVLQNGVLWRFIHHPESMVSRVFAAKYFPHGNPLLAEVGNRHPHAWRSLHHVAITLRSGFHIRVDINSLTSMLSSRWRGTTPISLETVYLDNSSNPIRCGDFMSLG
ncbi:uncharacterized mitochondrial protein AtMg00310-like [Hibiscus syriacus]|uniref:uncharacterized mitochondrial protein AtMg00310-like n=1 Tax=Hibiscus syriacus TaxID=106335 RepID=UPI0019243D2A|nr:uncharacterized mitochondrial protein AtMg00310-like [Hibiscus syriacus]